MKEDHGNPSDNADLENAILESLQESSDAAKKAPLPEELYVFPLLRRPFFPGMAAPLVVEPGPFYEALKMIVKTEQKCVGLLLAKSEEGDPYKKKLDAYHC